MTAYEEFLAALIVRRAVINREAALKAQTLLQRQCLPLDAKVQMSLDRIRAWYEHWDGEVYLSFSGGKDSLVLKHLTRRRYADVPAVFSNTGLEYPEIVQFVKEEQLRDPNIIIVRPKRTFRDVVLNEGYPVVSKKVSRQLRILKTKKDSASWANSYRLYDTGIKMDGAFSKASKLPDKYRPLLQKKWNATELCCDILKKEPLKTYATQTGRKPMTGTMVGEGGQRAKLHICNTYDAKEPISHPMLFWTEADVWEYIRTNGLDYSPIYDMGETRTGCMFCMFGVQFEKGTNRFQRMATSHPKQHKYCVEDLGMGQVLTDLGVPFLPNNETKE